MNQQSPAIETDRIVRERERRQITGVPRTSWWRAEKRGEVPESIPLIGDTKGWSLNTLLQWVDERKAAA